MDRPSLWIRIARSARPDVLRPRVPLWGMLSALAIYYAFVASAGTFTTSGWNSDLYDQLAEGMRAGHLYLPTVPSKELLARENPYTWESPDDWDAWLWDASLYKGRYYIYWGPVPGLLLWLVKAVTGYSHTIHDQWLVLFFAIVRLLAGSALIVRFARDQYPALPNWALYLALAMFALASPTPFVIARPVVYEASIAAGQGFLCMGLYCAYRGLGGTLRRTGWFVAAGSCLGLGLASRASLLVSAPLIIVITALCAQRPAKYPLRSVFGSLLALGTPAALSLAAYGVYNHLRFDAFYEFGLKYQLTGRPFETSNQYFLPNVVSYLSAELHWSCKFPFVTLPEKRYLSTWITWPSDYDVGEGWNGERAGGVLVATTICWLWLAWLWRAGVWLRHKYRGWRVRLSVPAPFSNRELWWVLCSLAAIAAAAPASRVYLASMRYLEDAASGMLMGAIAAGFWLLRPARARADGRGARVYRRLLGPALYTALALHTLFVGVCLGFTGYADAFPKENARLIGQLQRKLSVCGIKRRLHRLRLHALRPFDGDAIYVAWRDAPDFDSCQEGRPARP
jgi:hypothetical protein